MFLNKETRVKNKKLSFWIIFLCFYLGLGFTLQAVAKPLEKVVIQLKWFHQFQFAGYYAAIEKGFYKDEGLLVNLRERSPASSPVDEVISGTAQYGVLDSGLVLSREKGLPVVLVAQIFQYSPLVFITLKQSGLRTPYDLLGKRIMSDSAGSNDAALQAMLQKTLGDLSKVSWLDHSYDNNDLLAAKVDAQLAYLSNEPYWFYQQESPVNIIDPRDYGIDFYGDNLFTTEAELANHAQRIEKVRRATLKGWHYALKHKEEIIDLILDKYNSQNRTRDHLRYEAQEIEKMIMPDFIKLGHIEKSRYVKIAETFRQLKLIRSNNPLKGFFAAKQFMQQDSVSLVKISHINELSQELFFLDEVLTSSVMTYAFTGNEKWLKRYHQYEPKITEVLDEILSYADQNSISLVNQINQANDDLIALEAKAIDLVKSGNNKEALLVLESQNYQSEKQKLKHALNKFINHYKLLLKDISTENKNIKIKSLTDREKLWINSNTVKVGLPNWAPIVFMQKNGQAGGYLELLAQKTGLKFEYVSGLWEPLANGVQNKEVDIFPTAFYAQEGLDDGLYLQPFFKLPQAIYVKSDNHEIQNINDLANKSIAVVKDHGVVAQLKMLYPSIHIFETDNILQSINKVLKDEVEALIDTRSVVDLSIKNNGVKGLRNIKQAGISPVPIYFLSHHDNSILHSILNKGINAISDQEHRNEVKKWLPTHIASSSQITIKNKQSLIYLLIAALILFIALLVTAFLLPRILSDEVIAKHVSSKSFKYIIFLLTSAVFFVVLILVWYTVEQNRHAVIERVEKDLRFVHIATAERLLDWFDNRQNYLIQLGRDKKLITLVKKIQKLPVDKMILQASPLQDEIRTFFNAQQVNFGNGDFFIIDLENFNIAGTLDNVLGDENLISILNPNRLKRAFLAKSTFVPPLQGDIENRLGRLDSEYQKAYFLAPIQEPGGPVIAVLAQPISVVDGLSKIMQLGRIGQSGESYLADENGIMVSKSRFMQQLQKLSLMSKANQGLALKDPGGNLTKGFTPSISRQLMPLILSAQGLKKQANSEVISNSEIIGANLEGYRDYRGVEVFGVWHWNKQLGLGVITEIDRDEAMDNFAMMRKNLLTATIVTLLLAIASSLLTVTIGQRATRFMQRSRDELEEKVRERTNELKAREETMWDLYENAPVAYASLSTDGFFIKQNRTFAKLVGFPRETFQGLSWDKLVPDDFSAFEKTSTGQVLNDHQITIVRGDGKRLFTSLSTLPIKNQVNEIEEIRLTLIDISERKAAEKRFAALMESAPDAMLVVDLDGTLILVNSQVEKIFGFKREQLLGKKIEILVPEKLHSSHIAFREGYVADRKVKTIGLNRELLGRRSDDTTFPVEINLSPIQNDNEQLIVASVRDITQRRNDELRVAKNNRDLKTLTLINEAVMHSLTEKQLLHEVGKILVEESQMKFVWIGFERRDAQKSIHVEAKYGYEKGYLDNLSLSWSEQTQLSCPEGYVINRATPLIITNIADQPQHMQWRQQALDRGYHSLVAVPLVQNGDAFGVIAAYSDQVTQDSQENVQMLQRFVDNVSHGIMALRSETARKLAEQELSAAEERARLLLHSADEGIFGINTQGLFTFVNPAVEKMLGYHQNELIGQSVHPLIQHSYANAKHYPIKDSAMYAAYSQGDSNHVDDEVLWRKDGSFFEVEYSSVPLKKNNQLVGAVITFRDITSRKEAEVKMRAVWDNSGDGYLWMDSEFHFIACNQAAVNLLGCDHEEEILAKAPLDFSPLYQPDGELSTEKADKYAEQIQLGKSRRFEWYHLKKDGSGFWSEITLAYLMLRGKPVYLGVWHDVTVEREAREVLEKAKSAAEEATKAKSDFLANMSHEIRTPMNAIIGMSNLALKSDLNRKQRNYVEKVNRSAESLLGIINDILDFSKIEAGKLDMEKIPFRMEDVMDNLANLVGLKAEEKGLELLFDIQRDVPMALLGDPLRLGQILLNLGNNAVKFTEQGEVVVSTRIKTIDQERVCLHFAVRDTGIGMTNKQQKKLFSSFSQADSSTTRKYGGTGLGLTISKRLIEMMEGEIWFDSELNTGSIFNFTATFDRQEGVSSEWLKPQLPELQGLNVLAVDDNSTAREILVEILKSFDFKVTDVNSGQAAFDIIMRSDNHYDLVIMDWMMPGMDGVATTRLMQEQHKSLPPVILVTSYGREEASEAALGVKFGAILAKPISASTLLDTIMTAFGHRVEGISRASQQADEEIEAAAKLCGAKVLLVEDNEINQELAIELLNNVGVNSDLAENGQQAIEKLQTGTYDGVLMDCQMPVMDGFEATRLIRLQDQQLPIIAMTANVMAGDREKVLSAGMNDHIGKPINVFEMYSTMAKWIAPKQPFSHHQQLQVRKIGMDAPFPELPGIDIQAGLRTTLNNQKLYRKLLLKFYQSQLDFVNQYRMAEASQDPQAAVRCAHTLKGVAGNIGAKLVQDAAKELETAAKNGASENEISAYLEQVLDELKPVLKGLKTLDLQHLNITPKNSTFDKEKVQVLLQQLRTLLEDYDTDAIDIVNEIQDVASFSMYKKNFRRLSKAIDGYDFEQALEELEHFYKEILPS